MPRWVVCVRWFRGVVCEVEGCMWGGDTITLTVLRTVYYLTTPPPLLPSQFNGRMFFQWVEKRLVPTFKEVQFSWQEDDPDS